MRLQKYLAERGVASRRESARWIQAGRVSVNGRTRLEPGCKVDPLHDTVQCDGRVLPSDREPCRTILLHKPRGAVCSRDGQGRPTVYDHLGDDAKSLRAAGRLDAESEGLLLLSNDGALIQTLTHPRHGSAKTYRVRVVGRVDERTLRRLRSRMTIDGYRIQPVQVELVRRISQPPGTDLAFTLREGRNRQIRQMCRQAGLRVQRLVRIRQAGLELGEMKPGQWREISREEERRLKGEG